MPPTESDTHWILHLRSECQPLACSMSQMSLKSLEPPLDSSVRRNDSQNHLAPFKKGGIIHRFFGRFASSE